MVNNVTTLNTIAAAAADVTLAAGKLNIAGTVAGEAWSEKVKYLNITSPMKNGGVQGFLIEDLQVVSLAYTAAASTTYKFAVTQTINGNSVTQVITYISDSTGADATIASKIKTAFNALGFNIVCTGTATPLTFTAVTGNATFSIVNISNTTPTTTPTVTFTTALQAGSISNAEPRVVAATAHGLTNGMSVNIQGVTGNGLADVNGIHRITYIDANSFSLDGTSATGTVTVTSATGVTVAQNKFGYGADLVAAGVFNASSLNLYSLISVDYADPLVPLNSVSRTQAGNNQSIWVKAVLLATPNTLIANYGTLVTRMIAISHATGSGDAAAVVALA